VRADRADLIGCVSLSRSIVACPLTYSEQEKELLTVVPKGPAAKKRCAAWRPRGGGKLRHQPPSLLLRSLERSNGDRWHINVALLFDDTGKFTRRKWRVRYRRHAERERFAGLAQSDAAPGKIADDGGRRGTSNRIN